MAVKVLAKRGTAAQIEGAVSSVQTAGEIAFATDTKKFYVSDGTQFNKIGKDQLSQFSEISVVTDVNTWTINQDNGLDLNPPESNPTGITFKPDGTKVFTIGYSLNRVQMYDLSTAWDLTSAGSPTQSEYLVQNNLGSVQEDFFIDSSGTRMYVISRSSDSVSQFTLNTAWDISDITFVQDLHINSTSLSGGVTGIVTGEPDPAGITFKPDGTILYIVGYNQDKVHQIPLSTAWDISTHGTITEFNIFPANTSQAIQFSSDGTDMYIGDYSTESIVHFTLSTAWDVTTATLVSRGIPFLESFNLPTSTGFYFNDVAGKAFVCGRSGDYAYEVVITDAIKFDKPVSASMLYGDTIHAGSIITSNVGINSFYNTTYARSTFISLTTTYLGDSSRTPNIRFGNTVYGGGQVNVYRNLYTNTLGGNVPEFRIMQPRIGGRGIVKIGKEYEATTYLEGGVVDIESEASTFDHLGEFTLGGELKVGGAKPLAYKDPNLYASGTQIVLDNFNETTDTDITSHTPDTGSGYTQVYASNGVTDDDIPFIPANGGYLKAERSNSNDGRRYVNDTTISTNNYEVRAVIKQQVNSDDPFSIVVKYIDEDNYFVMHFAANYNYCYPFSVINGVATQYGALYYYANTSTADNLGLEVAVRVVGNQVSVFYEGEYRGSKEINITGAGKAGFGFGRTSDLYGTSFDLHTNISISKFEVYELPDSLFDGSDSVHYIENGKLGIGTTSPSRTLHVISTSSGDGIRISTSQDISVATLYNTNSESFPVGALSLQYGSNNAGLISGQSNRLNIRGGGSSGGSISFASHTTEMMRLTSTGLGIGTTAPSSPLHVAGNLFVDGSSLKVVNNSVTNYYDSDRMNSYGTYYDWRFAGNTKMRITSGGQLLLNGTTTSFSDKLYINGDAYVNGAWRVGTSSTYVGKLYNTIGILTLESDSTRDIQFGSVTNGTAMFIEGTNGKVGIGTTSPTALLHLESAEDSVLRLKSTDNKAFITLQDDDTNTYISAENSKLSLGGNPGVNANNLNFDVTNNSVGIGTSAPTSTLHVAGTARIHSAANGAYGTLTLGSINDIVGDVTYIDFKNNGSSWMRILNGNVGIGTTSPKAIVDIRPDGITGLTMPTFGTSAHSGIHIVPSGTANAEAWYGITFGNTAAGSSERERTTAGIFTSASGSYGNKLYFATSNSWATGAVSRMMIDHNGNVGIGTTSPETQLDITGNLTIGDKIYTRADGNRNTYIDSGTDLWRFFGGANELLELSYAEGAIFNEGGGDRDFRVESDINSHMLFVNAGENKVGIGVTNPERILDVGDTMMVRHATNANRKLVIGWGSMYPLSDTDEFQFLNGGAANSGMRFYGRFHSSAASKGNLFSSTGLMIGKSLTDLPDANTHVTIGGADTDTILLKVRNYSNANIFSVLGSGNVGIGTTSPTEKLHVNGNLRFMGSRFIGTTAATDNLDIIPERDLNLGTQATDNVWIGRASTWAGKVVIQANAANTMVVTDNKVGIGTTSPNAILDVQGSKIHLGTGGSNSNRAFFIANTTTNTFEFNNSVGDRGIRILTNSGLVGGAAASRLYGAAGGVLLEGANGQENIALTTDGKVGIGTTSPTEKLHVAGKGFFESIDIFKGDQFANPRLRIGRSSAETLNFDVEDYVARIYHKQDETGTQVHKLNLTVDSDSTGGSEINLGFRDNDGSNESTKLAILSSGNVGIGTTSPDASAILDIASTTKGVLFPRMTSSQRTAISSPTTGLIVYQTDATEGLYIYKSTGWTQII